MNSKRIALGIGIALLVLAVLTAHAAAHSAYFMPSNDSSATTGNTTSMDLYVEIDAGETLLSGQVQIRFDPTHVKVTENYLLCQFVDPTGSDQYCWEAFDTNFDSERNGSMWGGVSCPAVSKYYDPPGPQGLGWYWVGTEDGLFHGPVTIPVGTYEIKADEALQRGQSPFNCEFAHFPDYCPACQKTKFNNRTGCEIHGINWTRGSVTHTEEMTSGGELDIGENRISLPIVPKNNSTSEVLAGMDYSTVQKYVPGTGFVDAPTMDRGIGYIVDMNSVGSWSYDGYYGYNLSIELSEGLNYVGWTYTSAELPGALDSIAGNYQYVARWNASEYKFEVYDAMAPPGVPEFIDFTTMEGGVGYWIAATTDCTLTYSDP